MERFWNGSGAAQRIWRWTDDVNFGGAAGGEAAFSPSRIGPGGHVIGMVPGTYRVRVSAASWSSASCHYRLFIAKSPASYLAMPAW